jgi:hypothetical protein
MAKCGNCGAKLGCSCKVRKATDGKSCCVSCVTGYNTRLRQKNRGVVKKTSNTTPVLISATAVQKE